MKYKIFLSGIIVLVAACLSLRAEEGATSAVYYGNVDIAGKEYIFDQSESPANPCHPGLDPHPPVTAALCHCGLDPQSPVIYIAENTKIYDKDGRLSNGSNSSLRGGTTKQSGNMSETPSPPPPPSPSFLPSPLPSPSPSFLQGGKESATIPPNLRQDKPLPAIKAYKENTFRDINNSDLSLYHPEQRQKLSTAATQCGMLTTFISNPPPCPLKGEKKAFFDILVCTIIINGKLFVSLPQKKIFQ